MVLLIPCAVAALCVAMPDSGRPDSLFVLMPEPPGEYLTDEEGGLELMESLAWLRDHPRDLNRMTLVELLALPSVTDAEAKAVLDFRSERGSFQTTTQLLTMEGGGSHAFAAISPYVTVSPARIGPGSTSFMALRARAVRNLDRRTNAPGSDVQVYSRVVLQPVRGFETGMLLKRDAGEMTRDAFVSGYCIARRIVSFVDVVIGDFGVEAGQGLVLWSGAAISRSAWTVSGPRRAAVGLTPHRSTDESRFLRGAAIRGELISGRGRWQGTIFASRRSLAGTTDTAGEVRSIAAGAAFVTEALAAKRDAVREWTAGGRIEFTYAESMTAGLTYYTAWFDRMIRRDDSFRFSGRTYSAGGADIRVPGRIVSVFGEVARMVGGFAWTAGAAVGSDERFSLLFSYRDYQPGFDNPHAAGFGENNGTRNEQGVYVGISIQPLRWLTVRTSLDHSFRPAPTTLIPYPAGGDEFLADANMRLTAALAITLRYVRKRTSEHFLGRDAWSRDVRTTGERLRETCRIGGSVRFARTLRLETRLETAWVNDHTGDDLTGLVLVQNGEWHPSRAMTLSGGVAIFHTDSYSARMYGFQEDLPGIFSSHLFNGRGRQWHVMLSISPARWGTVTARYDSNDADAGVSSETPVRDIGPGRDARWGLQLDIHL